MEPNSDCVIRPEVTRSKIQIDDEKPTNYRIGSERFVRFSTWESLVRGVKLLKLFVRKRIKHSDIDSVTTYELAELFVIQTVQREAYNVQYLADQFWQRWQVEYMHNLQTRQKWLKNNRKSQKGDVVLIAQKPVAAGSRDGDF